jgi:hypothetical protein
LNVNLDGIHAENSKHQHPSPRETSNTKLQIPARIVFDVSNLELLWMLELGI